jgi:hypothetical protein
VVNPWEQWRVEHELKSLIEWMQRIHGIGPAGATCATCRSLCSKLRCSPFGVWTVHRCRSSSKGWQWRRSWSACGIYQAREVVKDGV